MKPLIGPIFALLLAETLADYNESPSVRDEPQYPEYRTSPYQQPPPCQKPNYQSIEAPSITYEPQYSREYQGSQYQKPDYLVEYIRQLNPYEQIYKKDKQCINLVDEIRRITLDSKVHCYIGLAKSLVENHEKFEHLIITGQILIRPGQVGAEDFLEGPVPREFHGTIKAALITEKLLGLLERKFRIQKWEKPEYVGVSLSSFCTPRDQLVENDPLYFYQNRVYRSLNRLAEPYCTLNREKQACELPNARKLSLFLGEQHVISKAQAGVYENKVVPTVQAFNFFHLAVHDSVWQRLRSSNEGNYGFSACSKDNKRKLDDSITDPESIPIRVSSEDPFYGPLNVTCLEFIRAQTANDDCRLKELSFLNRASPEINNGQVYGDHPDQIEALIGPKGEFKTDETGFPLIVDSRSEQTDLLLSTHIMGINLHNAIANSLRSLYPQWSDQIVFHQAHRLAKIISQAFIYRDLIPAFIGQKVATKYGLNDFRNCYNPDIDTQTLAEFTCAAARYIHCFCTETAQLADPQYRIVQEILLRETFRNNTLTKNAFKEVARGMILQPVHLQKLSIEAQSLLFPGKFGPYGHDLFTLDVTRSRDCCLKPYVHYLKLFFGACVRSFDDLREFLPAPAVEGLKKHYKHVEDVDLYVGGSLETPWEDGFVGRTFSHIIALQYQRYKCGDPKFFTAILNDDQKAALAQVQLDQVYAVINDLDLVLDDIMLAKPDRKLVERQFGALHEMIDFSKLINTKLNGQNYY